MADDKIELPKGFTLEEKPEVPKGFTLEESPPLAPPGLKKRSFPISPTEIKDIGKQVLALPVQMAEGLATTPTRVQENVNEYRKRAGKPPLPVIQPKPMTEEDLEQTKYGLDVPISFSGGTEAPPAPETKRGQDVQKAAQIPAKVFNKAGRGVGWVLEKVGASPEVAALAHSTVEEVGPWVAPWLLKKGIPPIARKIYESGITKGEGFEKVPGGLGNKEILDYGMQEGIKPNAKGRAEARAELSVQPEQGKDFIQESGYGNSALSKTEGGGAWNTKSSLYTLEARWKEAGLPMDEFNKVRDQIKAGKTVDSNVLGPKGEKIQTTRPYTPEEARTLLEPLDKKQIKAGIEKALKKYKEDQITQETNPLHIETQNFYKALEESAKKRGTSIEKMLTNSFEFRRLIFGGITGLIGWIAGYPKVGAAAGIISSVLNDPWVKTTASIYARKVAKAAPGGVTSGLGTATGRGAPAPNEEKSEDTNILSKTLPWLTNRFTTD